MMTPRGDGCVRSLSKALALLTRVVVDIIRFSVRMKVAYLRIRSEDRGDSTVMDSAVTPFRMARVLVHGHSKFELSARDERRER